MDQKKIEEIIEKIADIVKNRFSLNKKEIHLSTIISENAELDIRKTEAIMDIEEEFDIEISDKEAKKINTVKDLIDYVLQNPLIQLINATPADIDRLVEATKKITDKLYPNPRKPIGYYDGPCGSGEIFDD